MSRGKAAALATLARLKRHEMDAIAAEMGEVSRRLGALESERAGLLERIQERGDPTSVESARHVADFVRNVNEALRRTERRAARITEESAELHARLVDSFAEAKRIDILSDRLAAERRATAQARESAEQEEVFLAAHTRRRRGY